jgi:hypothetical protein
VAHLVRIVLVASLASVICPALANAATTLPPGCPPAVAMVQKYPVVRMPNVVNASVSKSKIAASVYESSERLVGVTTNDPAQQGTVAKQCPAAGRLVNENPKTGVPGVSLWIYQYQPADSPLSASAMVTDSKYSDTPLWLISPAGGPYWLRINYTPVTRTSS